MARSKAKKNYLEDMDRDFNNAKFAHELSVKKGWDTDPLNEVAGQITLDAIAYVISDLVDELRQHVNNTEDFEWSDSAYYRLNDPWTDLVLPAYESNFEGTSKSEVALDALNRVSTFNDEELEAIKKCGKIDLMDLTINCFAPIREFYERNTV
jgi:hypothetical protein